MAPRCTVCAHTSRADIDQALARGVADREAARLYGLSRESVRRHRIGHLAPTVTALAGQIEALNGPKILAEVAGLYERTVRLLDRAEQADDISVALKAVREVRGCIESWARIGLAVASQTPEERVDDVNHDLDARIEQALRERVAREAGVPLALPVHVEEADVLEVEEDAPEEG